jgi:hypothetical protein
MNRLLIAYKALTELGIQPVMLNALYRLGLASGHYRRAEEREKRTESREQREEISSLRPLFSFPRREDLLVVIGKDGKTALLAEADEIAEGKVRLFGAEPVELNLILPGPLAHWTAYETGKAPLPLDGLSLPDIKFLWEPARFGWAFPLGRAYHLSGEERYAEAFWLYFETFSEANPPCLGPHWMSAQEVALRLMAFTWAGEIFADASASTAERRARLAAAVAAHAARIPPTLVYARSQQNNHLLTEAAGLLTAGLALPEHADATRWRSLGWRWLNSGLQAQIDAYGEYGQHSTNYQRLMLQVALWANALAGKAGLRWPRPTLEAVKRSVHWLLALLDPESGCTPNLGANDGAYIFPLSSLPFSDHRPVAHAAARAFLDYELPTGPWDEMALWFGARASGPKVLSLPRYLGDQLYGKVSWAFLRTAQYNSRPSHADQLHLDLWWRGMNITRDAGTYLYNAPAPWENSLTTALVHNTVTVNGRDQMTRAGRFLYLDWVNAYRKSEIAYEADIFQRMRGRYRSSRDRYRHTRTVYVTESDGWVIRDEVLSTRLFMKGKAALTLRIHWLLPDWLWEIQPLPPEFEEFGCDLRLHSPRGWLTVRLHTDMLKDRKTGETIRFGLVRAGEKVYGNIEPSPLEGWYSPTYGVKLPALSFSMVTDRLENTGFVTEFILPEGK